MCYQIITFDELLKADINSFERINLSNYSLIECIEEMCRIKSKAHPSLFRNHSCVIYNLRLIEDKYGRKIYPYVVGSVFWNLFIQFLIDRKLKLSTINTIKAQIITTLNWASKYGAQVNPSYEDVHVPKYSSTNISLTPDEVSHIYHFKLENVRINGRRIDRRRIDTLDKVRDMFVLSCCLGQRHSDMVRINRDNFDGGGFSITQQKTGNKCRVEIPLMVIDKRMVYEILEKYNYEAPYRGDLSNYNRYLKMLLRIIGERFVEDVHIETKINGNVSVSNICMYKLVGSHTARRTFATINFERNIPKQKILRATGHSTETSFNKYICYGDD